jgi:hypothetical protein
MTVEIISTTSQETTSTISSSTTTTKKPGGGFVCPRPDGRFPNPDDCHSFYTCIGGVPYLQVSLLAKLKIMINFFENEVLKLTISSSSF